MLPDTSVTNGPDRSSPLDMAINRLLWTEGGKRTAALLRDAATRVEASNPDMLAPLIAASARPSVADAR